MQILSLSNYYLHGVRLDTLALSHAAQTSLQTNMKVEFHPERWLGESGRNLQPYFLAFSAGSRGCIGRNISYLEQTVVLASILKRYNFALPHCEWDIDRLETLNLLLGPMPVKVWRR